MDKQNLFNFIDENPDFFLDPKNNFKDFLETMIYDHCEMILSPRFSKLYYEEFNNLHKDLTYYEIYNEVLLGSVIYPPIPGLVEQYAKDLRTDLIRVDGKVFEKEANEVNDEEASLYAGIPIDRLDAEIDFNLLDREFEEILKDIVDSVSIKNIESLNNVNYWVNILEDFFMLDIVEVEETLKLFDFIIFDQNDLDYLADTLKKFKIKAEKEFNAYRGNY